MFRTFLSGLCFLLTIPALAQTPKSSMGSPSGKDRCITRLVLQVDTPSSATSVPIDSKVIRKELNNWFMASGIEVVESGAFEPDKTYHLKIWIQTVRTRDNIYIYHIVGRCSRLSDVNLVSNEQGQEQKIWFSNCISGQKGNDDFQNNIILALHSALKDMPVLGLFRSSQENQSKINQISSSQGGAKNVENNIIHDIKFSHVKVRNQPPPPPYPAVAKAKRVQGTVDVLIVVDPLGTPIRVDALTGPPELLVTAIRYALKWEFEPQRINCLPVSARFKLIMPFTLSDNPLLPLPKN